MSRFLLLRLLHDKRATTAIEYAMMAGMISVLIVLGVTQIGTTINSLFFGPIISAL
jgi:Flp pilus assembly pilin Flp